MASTPTLALSRFGWSPSWREQLESPDAESRVGRITLAYRGGYRVRTEHGEVDAMSTGRMRSEARRGGAGLPVVGDWVVLRSSREPGTSTVEHILPRRTYISRKASGRTAVEQVLVANIDYAFVVSSFGFDLNVARIERLVTLVHGGGSVPVVVLTKADTCPDVSAVVDRVRTEAPNVAIHAISAVENRGLDALEPYFENDATVSLIGSSGVGKSTLVNAWLGHERQATLSVRDDGRGRHTTTGRHLFARPGGGVVIDTPGLREVGLFREGVDDAFEDIAAAASRCRFADCRHEGEPGCEVALACARRELDPARVERWRELHSELSTVARRHEERKLARARATKPSSTPKPRKRHR